MLRLGCAAAFGMMMLVAPAVGMAAAGARGDANNLVPNPSVEELDGKQPKGWRTEKWNGEGAFECADVGHTGRHSLCISSTGGADVAWTTNVPLEAYSIYRLSAWIKTENVKVTNGRGR